MGVQGTSIGPEFKLNWSATKVDPVPIAFEFGLRY